MTAVLRLKLLLTIGAEPAAGTFAHPPAGFWESLMRTSAVSPSDPKQTNETNLPVSVDLPAACRLAHNSSGNH